MPDRVVRADILTSDAVNSLSWAGETFYRRLMSIADDYGRCEARPSLLRASLYPLKLDRVSEPDVVKWMGECSKAGLLRTYTVDDKEYLEILKFGQRLRAMKSRYPAPPANHCGQMSADDDSRQHMSAIDGMKRNESETETESETEKIVSPKGDGEADASPPDHQSVYKQLEKNKKSICQFIKTSKPLFIEPYSDLWNLFAKEKGLAQVTKISDQRKRKFRVRIKEAAFDFIEILKKAGKSEFLLTGKWFCFDWIMENESNYLKVIEGNYEKMPDGTQPVKNEKPAQKTFDEGIKYLLGRFQEGQLDERLILPEYYDKLVVYGAISVGTMDKQPGDTFDEKKKSAVLEYFKNQSNAVIAQ